MQVISAADVQQHLGWNSIIDALQEMFIEGCEAPVRHHHNMQLPGQADATMLIMPAWIAGKYAGLKLVNVYPDNSQKNLPSIMGGYLLMDGATGAPLAFMDAAELTARRTAGTSALAARYLSREDSSKLLIVGSGRMAMILGHAHAEIRPISDIQVWSRTPEKAQQTVQHYRDAGFHAEVVHTLEEGVRWADIVSCATMSEEPLILGEWVQPGTHIDLVGAYKPTMRETDDALVSMSMVFADTLDGVLAEAGDLLIPIANGTFSRDDIAAELADLARGNHPGRSSDSEITLFKSVGASLEDLAGAIRCYESYQQL